MFGGLHWKLILRQLCINVDKKKSKIQFTSIKIIEFVFTTPGTKEN